MGWENLREDIEATFGGLMCLGRECLGEGGGYHIRTDERELRRLRRLAGRCLDCEGIPESGRSRCRPCGEKSRVQQRRRIQRRRNAGICCYGGCKRPSVLIGRSRYYCAEHREVMRATSAYKGSETRKPRTMRAYLVTELPSNATHNRERNLWVTPDGQAYQLKPGPVNAWLKLYADPRGSYHYWGSKLVAVSVAKLVRETFPENLGGC